MAMAAVVLYHTTRQWAARNRRLIENVLAELSMGNPGGLYYQVLQFDDGLGFMHIAVFDGTADPFAQSRGNREFHRELGHRLSTRPKALRAVLVGAYDSTLIGTAAPMNFGDPRPQ